MADEYRAVWWAGRRRRTATHYRQPDEPERTLCGRSVGWAAVDTEVGLVDADTGESVVDVCQTCAEAVEMEGTEA